MHDHLEGKGHAFRAQAWLVVALAILLFSTLRGIRFPNLWSYSHFLFHYEFGFTKRGLIGEAVRQLENPYLTSYEFFLLFSATLLFLNILLLALLIRDLIRGGNPSLLGAALLFASSSAVVFLSHTIGYFDHLGLFMALVTLKLSGFYRKLIFVAITMPIALLIHEATLILFFPVIFMSLLLAMEGKGRRHQLIALGLFAALALALTTFISGQGLDRPEAHKMFTGLQQTTHNGLRGDAFAVLHRDPQENARLMKLRWSKPGKPQELALSLLVTLPLILLFNYLSTSALRAAKARMGIILLAAAASLSPLLLHPIAWDMHRWNTLAVTTSFLMLYIACRYRPETSSTDQPNRLLPLLVFILFVNGIASIPLFDGYHVRQFPFAGHIEYIQDVSNGKATFPHIPPR